MQTFDVQSIGIKAPASKVFAFVAEPSNLSRWTNAFKRADDKTALMATPQGEVDIGLTTVAHAGAGSVDWKMTFPDGSVGTAYSRVTPDGDGAIYSFVLMAPPVALEALEGALEAQRGILAEELKHLKSVMENQ